MKKKKRSDSLNSSVELEDSDLGLKVVTNISPTKGKKHEAYNVHSTKGISPTLRAQMGGACQGSQLILDASGVMTSTNTPAKSTGKGLEITGHYKNQSSKPVKIAGTLKAKSQANPVSAGTTLIMEDGMKQASSMKEISVISEQSKFLSLTFLQQDSPARVFPLLENAKVFRTEQGELFSLRSAGSLEIKDQASYSLRMLKDYFHMMEVVLSQLYSFHWMNLGMMQNGKCSTLNIGCPKTGKESLSSVLEGEVNEKYYLDDKFLNKMIEYNKRQKENDRGFRFEPKEEKEIADALQTGKGQQGGQAIKDKRIRRLTPRECERLQGFPDDWTKECSDTQRYKQMGNAVSVPVITAIGKAMLEALK